MKKLIFKNKKTFLISGIFVTSFSLFTTSCSTNFLNEFEQNIEINANALKDTYLPKVENNVVTNNSDITSSLKLLGFDVLIKEKLPSNSITSYSISPVVGNDLLSSRLLTINGEINGSKYSKSQEVEGFLNPNTLFDSFIQINEKAIEKRLLPENTSERVQVSNSDIEEKMELLGIKVEILNKNNLDAQINSYSIENGLTETSKLLIIIGSLNERIIILSKNIEGFVIPNKLFAEKFIVSPKAINNSIIPIDTEANFDPAETFENLKLQLEKLGVEVNIDNIGNDFSLFGYILKKITSRSIILKLRISYFLSSGTFTTEPGFTVTNFLPKDV